jgi:hypothetical protein
LSSNRLDTWEHALVAIATEHGTLVSARAAAVSDSSARANLFLGAVSSSIVALAFVGQAQHFGPAVKTFAFVLLPVLIFLGIVTFARALEDAGQEQLFARAINRLRRYYTDVYPHTLPYFTFADDIEHSMQITSSGSLGWERRITTPTSIAVINSAIVGVFAGLLVSAIAPVGDIFSFACGIGGASAMLAWNVRYETAYWRAFDSRIAERYADRVIPETPASFESGQL